MESSMASGPVLVLGATGQIGRALAGLLGGRGISLSRQDLDLAQPARIESCLDRFRAAAVINAMAYTQVDRAEMEEDLATAVNGHAVGAIARWCAARGIPFVHYSTDYVFSGEGEAPWREEDPLSPLNAYGRSKAEGDRQVAAAGGRWLIFRPTWVYDAQGKNFVQTILRQAQECEELSVVEDQFGAPTYAPHLAEASLLGLERALRLAAFPSGVYHLCNSGVTTWHGFAEAILQAAQARGWRLKARSVRPVPAAAYPVAAQRPQNSRLDTDKAYRVLGLRLPDWRVGLEACLEAVTAPALQAGLE